MAPLALTDKIDLDGLSGKFVMPWQNEKAQAN
jgi:hypothetical protein